MKKLVIMASAAIAITTSSCNFNQEQLDRQQQTIDSLQAVNYEKDSDMALLAQTMSELQRNINAIKKEEGIVSVNMKNGEADENQMRDDIRAIYAKLVENKKKVEELQRRLNASASKNKEYTKIISILKEQIEQQNAEIERLNTLLNEKNIEISFLNDAVIRLSGSTDSLASVSANQQDVIEKQTHDLQQGFYIIGEKSFLKEKGLIEGIFKKSTTGNVKDELFTEVNTTTTEQIPLTGRRWVVISKHPESSYTIDEANSVLRITNKDEFWKATKYLIIRARGVDED